MKQLFLLCACCLTLTPPALLACQDLAERNGCMQCHQLDHKTVGPAIREIAKKYAGQPEEVARLLAKAQNGGGGGLHGVWGQVPMPPNPQVSDADVKVILNWMLDQK
jgi:cytochrome c